jgi:hypothetical protein
VIMEIEDRRDDVAGAKELFQNLANVIGDSRDGLTPTAVHTALILLVDSFLWATDIPCGEFCERLIETSRVRANSRGTRSGPCCPPGRCKEGHDDSLKCSRWKR